MIELLSLLSLSPTLAPVRTLSNPSEFSPIVSIVISTLPDIVPILFTLDELSIFNLFPTVPKAISPKLIPFPSSVSKSKVKLLNLVASTLFIVVVPLKLIILFPLLLSPTTTKFLAERVLKIRLLISPLLEVLIVRVSFTTYLSYVVALLSRVTLSNVEPFTI